MTRKFIIYSMLMIAMLVTILIFGSGCQKALQLKGVKAVNTRVETTISTTTTGTVEARNQAVLTFNTIGRVEAVLINAGQTVRKNQLLAKLENRELALALENAAKELKRAEELFTEGLTSRSNLDQARNAHEVARANIDKTLIRAPFDGAVTDVNLHVGELSQIPPSPEKPPIRLVDQETRLIKGEIDETDLSRVKPGLQAKAKISAVSSTPLPAIVDRVVPYVNSTKEQERTAEVELGILDNTHLIPVGASA
ncbi:MAG: efflux RND transporter periplasmic adaptor subunit, partial [Bdellovibrionota bacterium]